MQNKKLIIFGAGDIADLAHYYFTTFGRYEVAGFVVDLEYIDKPTFLNLPVVAFDKAAEIYPCDYYDMFIAVSYTRLNKLRAERFEWAQKMGYFLPSFIHPTVTAWKDQQIGENCLILENVVLQPYSMIGNNVTIWSGTHIGHHSIIGNHCFITSHCVVSGHVVVGEYSFIGVNATLRNGITIGARSIIGAGALLLEDAPLQSVYGAKATGKAPFDSSRVPNV